MAVDYIPVFLLSSRGLSNNLLCYLVFDNRIIFTRLPLDFGVSSIGLAIDLNGIWWWAKIFRHASFRQQLVCDDRL